MEGTIALRGIAPTGLPSKHAMSALGQTQTCAAQEVMSALLPKADMMCGATRDVRFVPKADTASAALIIRRNLCRLTWRRDMSFINDLLEKPANLSTASKYTSTSTLEVGDPFSSLGAHEIETSDGVAKPQAETRPMRPARP